MAIVALSWPCDSLSSSVNKGVSLIKIWAMLKFTEIGELSQFLGQSSSDESSFLLAIVALSWPCDSLSSSINKGESLIEIRTVLKVNIEWISLAEYLN